MDKQAIEDRIRNGEIESALQLLMESLAQMSSSSALYQEALALSAALKDGQRQVARGIIAPAHYQSIRSRVVAGIQEIVRQAEAPQIQEVPIGAGSRNALKAWIAIIGLASFALLWGYFRLQSSSQQKPDEDITPRTETQEVQPQESKPSSPATTPQGSTRRPSDTSIQPQNPTRHEPAAQPGQSAPTPVDAASPSSAEVEIWLSSVDCRIKVNNQEPDVTAGHNTQKRKLRLPVGAAKITVICGPKVCSFTRDITLGMPSLHLNCQ